MRICIGGGGLAGLSLAYHLRNSDVEYEILEKDEKVGGLLKSEEHEGFTFDIGGSHILFSKDEGILREMVNLIGRVVMHRRRTFIHYRDKFIKYPFENGIFSLAPEERYEIVRDFVMNLMKKKEKPRTLRDFFIYLFGEKIVEKYLGPYNAKIWKRNLEDIVFSWGEDWIPIPPIDDVLRAAVGIETEGYLHQLRFFYPLEGGIETLARRIAENVKNIKTNTPIISVKGDSSGVSVNGESYDYFVSTIPLPELARIVGNDAAKLADRLDYNSVTVVGLGVKGNLPDYHWIYIPDRDIIFHRLAIISNYSPNMAPPGRETIIAEISHRDGDVLKDAIDETIVGIEKLGFKFEVDVAKMWTNRYAYVITDRNYEKTVGQIRKILRDMRIITLGRHGNWEYLNMDAVWARSVRLAKEIRGLK